MFPRRYLSPFKDTDTADDEHVITPPPKCPTVDGPHYLPRRVSELTPLKSDSDIDDDDDLNSARFSYNNLDDDDDDDGVPLATQISSPATVATKENDKNFINNSSSSAAPAALNGQTATDSGTAINKSISSQFAQMSFGDRLDNYNNKEPAKTTISAHSEKQHQLQRSISDRRPPAFGDRKSNSTTEKSKISLFKNIAASADVSAASSCASSSFKKSTIVTCAAAAAATGTIETNETPMRSTTIKFETPSLQWQVPPARCPPLRSKSDLHNEFQSKKILFTTPKAIGAGCPLLAPIGPLSNDLSLCDSPAPVEQPAAARKIENNDKTLTINGKTFLIGTKIGAGGSSAVFLAESVSDARTKCAIKVVNLLGDPAVIDGYINETKMLAKLQGNQCVIRLFDYYHSTVERRLYMIMECGDTDLQRVLQQYSSHIPLHKLMRYWYEMLLSVQYIHANGIIHSDLKPANFLMVNGRLKLIDFGIASNIAVDSTSVIKFSQSGTFNYISPETLLDTSTGNTPGKRQPKVKISTKSDVWSLGCILYLLLYRRTPFAHIKNICTKIHAITDPNTQIDFPKFPHFYPPLLLEMLQKCLIFNPKKRASVSELLAFPFDMVIDITTTTTTTEQSAK